MPAVTTITDPSGTDWTLDGSGGLWEGQGKKGFHGTTYQHYRDESPFVPGAFWRGVRALPRELFIPVIIRDPNRDQVLAKRRALMKAISPVHGECILTSSWPDGSVRRIRARYVDGLDAGTQGPGEYGITVIKYGIRFIADQPYMYGDAVNTTWSLAAQTRTELPIPGADTFFEVVSSPLLTSNTPGTPLNSNTDFEVNTANWTGIGGTLSRDTSVFKNGVASAKLVPDGVSANGRIDSDHYTVSPGVPYVASAWLACATARFVNLNVNWYDSGNAYISTSSAGIAVSANVFTYISKVFTAPVNAAFAAIIPTVASTPPSTDILWADDVVLSLAGGVPLTNPGDVDTWPTWSFGGPFGSIIVTNTVTSKTFTISYSAATSANRLFLNTDPGGSFLLDENGTNRWNALTDGYQLWPLVSGENPVVVQMTGVDTNSLATLSFNPLYEAD